MAALTTEFGFFSCVSRARVLSKLWARFLRNDIMCFVLFLRVAASVDGGGRLGIPNSNLPPWFLTSGDVGGGTP